MINVVNGFIHKFEKEGIYSTYIFSCTMGGNDQVIGLIICPKPEGYFWP